MSKLDFKKLASKIYHGEYLPFALLFLVGLVIFSQIELEMGTDDGFLMEMLQNLSVLEFVYQWGTVRPRIFSDFFLALVNGNMPLWMVLNAFMLTLLILILCKMVTLHLEDKRKIRFINAMVCCSFFLIAPHVIVSSTMWYTGSFYYLWPTTMMLITFIPFYYAIYGEIIKYKILYPLIVIATFCACYMEQTVAILVCFGGVTLIFLKLLKKRLPRILIVQYIIIWVNGIFYGLRSLITNRSLKELHWYPSFEMLTFVDKVFQGVNWSTFHLVSCTNLLMFVLSIAIYTNIRLKNKGALCFFGAIPMLFFAGRILPWDVIFKNVNVLDQRSIGYTGSPNTYKIEAILGKLFYNPIRASPTNLETGFGVLLPSIFGLTVILFIAVLLWIVFEKLEGKFTAVLLYLAALASGYVIGFSPTIFASGKRVFFITNILILFVLGQTISEALTITSKKYYNGITFGFVAVAALLAMQLALDFSHGSLCL